MPKTEDRTPILGLRYWRWPENKSVQQLVCCLSTGCLMAVGRMMKEKGRPFDPQLGRRLERAALDITETCGRQRASMSAGTQRSILAGVQTILESFPDAAGCYVSDMQPRMVRIVGAAAWPLLDDAARLCNAWVPKAKGLWAEARELLWEWVERECRTFPTVADEGWLLTERVINAAGYYI